LLLDCVVIRMGVHVVPKIAVWDRDECVYDGTTGRLRRLCFVLCACTCAGLMMIVDVVKRRGGCVMSW
jgi:hypothetical protein